MQGNPSIDWDNAFYESQGYHSKIVLTMVTSLLTYATQEPHILP